MSSHNLLSLLLLFRVHRSCQLVQGAPQLSTCSGCIAVVNLFRVHRSCQLVQGAPQLSTCSGCTAVVNLFRVHRSCQLVQGAPQLSTCSCKIIWFTKKIFYWTIVFKEFLLFIKVCNSVQQNCFQKLNEICLKSSQG